MFASEISVNVNEGHIERPTLVVIDSVFVVGSMDRLSSDHFEIVLCNDCSAVASLADHVGAES